MESLKKLLEEKKPTNNYKSAEPEQTQKIHSKSYQKDLGLIDSPLSKRGGAPGGNIQKAKLADKRYANLPTVAQLKAQDYFSGRQRPIAQNPDLGGAIKTKEDQYGQSHSLLDEEIERAKAEILQAEDETLQAIQEGNGQPPAKIANPRGQSGSSGVYRTTVGPIKSFEKAFEGNLSRIKVDLLARFLEHYNFVQQKATATYGI